MEKKNGNTWNVNAPNLESKRKSIYSLWVLLTRLWGALAAQLRFGLAVADGGDVLAALHGRVPACGVGARWLLHVLHFHLLVVDPQIRGPQVLLAALPFAGAVGRTFPAAKKKENRHVRTCFLFVRPQG